MGFPICIAPIKCLILPISNNVIFKELTKKVALKLTSLGISNKIDDSSATIGRRYARNDELGAPLAITIDFQSVKDGSITLRERDSMDQVRGDFEQVMNCVKDLVEEKIEWEQVELEKFVQQDN